VSGPLGADTDLLNGQALADYKAHIQRILDQLDGVGEANVAARAQIDKIVNQTLPPSLEALKFVVDSLENLSQGDQGQVDALRKILENAEERAIEEAKAFGGRHG
jgi:hypothetical protein